MAETYTNNLGLTKPDYDSPADISVINSNMDKIDNAVANAGKVKSVNGKSPDAAGAVTLGAEDVGALATDATAANSAKLGGKAPEYYLQTRNLLDNSDFTNTVNQRGQTSYSGGYTIDRWRIWDEGEVNITNGYLYHSVALYQYISNLDKNKTYTLAFKSTDGRIYCSSSRPIDNVTGDAGINIFYDENIGVCARFWADGGYREKVWAALYEGEYTADTLPPYVPKGYAAELAECQRYYQKYKFSNTSSVALGLCFSETKARFTVTIPPMRAIPNVMFETPTEHVPYVSVEGNVVAKGNLNYTAIGVKYGRVMSIDVSITGGITNMPAVLMTNSSASLVLSADL